MLKDIGSDIVVCEYTVCGCMKPLSHVQSVPDMFRNSYCMGSCVNLRRDRYSGKICTANFPSHFRVIDCISLIGKRQPNISTNPASALMHE